MLADGSPAPRGCRVALTRSRVAVCWALIPSMWLAGAQASLSSQLLTALCSKMHRLQMAGDVVSRSERCWQEGRRVITRAWHAAPGRLCCANWVARRRATDGLGSARWRNLCRCTGTGCCHRSQRWLLTRGFPVKLPLCQVRSRFKAARHGHSFNTDDSSVFNLLVRPEIRLSRALSPASWRQP